MRNIPDDTAAILKKQAKSSGLTFEAYLRLKLIELAKKTKNMTTDTITLQQALEASDYSEATMVDQNGFRVTVAQESKRIRVSEGPDGGFAQLQNDIHTMEQFQEYYPEFYTSDRWEVVGEADS